MSDPNKSPLDIPDFENWVQRSNERERVRAWYWLRRKTKAVLRTRPDLRGRERKGLLEYGTDPVGRLLHELVRREDIAADALLQCGWEPPFRKRVKSRRGNNPATNRKAFILNLLKEKHMSLNGWAKKAKVDHHTVSGYVNGKTKTYQTTRKLLADALGIKEEELPQ